MPEIAILPSQPRRRPWIWVVLVGAVLIAGILGFTTEVIIAARQRALHQAQEGLRSLDLLLSEQTVRALQGVDLVLSGVGSEISAHHLTNEATFDKTLSSDAVHQQLAAKITGLPQLNNISIVDASGNLINFSSYWPGPKLNVADRDYFRALRDGPANAPTFISVAVRNRVTGTRTMFLARRLNSPDGKFLGVVLGSIRLEYFRSLYASVSASADTAISLWNVNGNLLVRYPPTPGDPSLEHLPPQFIGHIPHGNPLLLITHHGDLPDMRLVATMIPNAYPVVVSVARSRNVALADWSHDATVIGTGGLACTSLVLLLMVMMIRQFTAYQKVQNALLAQADAVRGREDAEARLRQAQKMEAIGQLTAGLAHDFNNLLATISGNIERLATEGGQLPQRPLRLIRGAADRAATLTRQLLAFSRQQILQPEALDLAAVLQEMSALLGSSLGGTIAMLFRLPPDLWPVYADRMQIERVMLNLVFNARDAMPNGGQLVIAAENIAPESPRPADLAPGAFIRLTISDNGMGMNDDVVARAFDPFFTTKGPGHGTGLGLSQVYGFARQSGGTVQIDSRPGAGTSVTIFLPRAAANIIPPGRDTDDYLTPDTAFESTPDTAPPASLAPAPVAAAAVINQPAGPDSTPPAEDCPAKGRRILLVEDDPLVRDTVADALEHLGYHPLVAVDGFAAIAILEGGAVPDGALVDFAMPGINGLETAHRLRAMQPRLPVMFMTGYADPTPLRGERWILLKPFTMSALSRMLVEALPVPVPPAE